MRVLPLIAGVAVLATLAGCGPAKPQWILSAPPVPAQTGAPVPFTPVREPVDLAKFHADPCGQLTREQVAAVVADPPDSMKSGSHVDNYTRGCLWNAWPSPFVSVVEPVHEPLTLTELKNSSRRRSGAMDPWTETSVSGLPAVVYHESPGPEECEVAVGVSDSAMLLFSFFGKGTHSTYWNDDRCGGVLKTAEFVVGNLRKG